MSPEENKGNRLDQNEIDSLLGNTKPGSVPAGPEKTADAEVIYGGEISGEQIIRQADIDSLLEQAKGVPAAKGSSGINKLLAADSAQPGKGNLNLLMDIGLNVKIELGKTSLPLEEILKLHEGSVVELDKLAGDPLDIVVNGRLIARGEVLVLNDNFCVRITDILSPEDRLKATTAKKKL